MITPAEKLRQNAERVRANQNTAPAVESVKPTDSVEAESLVEPPPLRSEEAASEPEPSQPVTVNQRKAVRKGQASSASDPVFAPRQTPIRRTVDLSPDQHDKLDNWQRQTAREIGRARITGQQVISTLVRRLLEDEELARTVRDEIYRNQ